MKIAFQPRRAFLLTAFLTFIFLSKFSAAQNDVCGSAPAIGSSTPPGTCTGGTLAAAATYTAGGGVPGCGGADDDVWYKFVAATSSPTITYTAGTLVNGRIQLFSGACGGLTSVACGTTSISATGLTVGNTYYIRIYSTTNAAGTFTVCIIDPPANDLCANAITLTPGASCSNTAGTVVAATYTGILTDCSGSTPTYDVWYKFVAGTANTTITLSSVGANFNTPRLQLFSGTCGSLTSVACSTSPSLSLTTTGLTVGNTYYVRAYSLNGAAPVTNGAFNICIVNSPSNDDCSGATSLTESATCSNTAGTLIGATTSAGVPGSCGDPNSADVWYKFVAQTSFPVITLSSIGANLSAAGIRIQLLSGACGSLSSLACVTSSPLNTFTAVGGTGLTIGATYYVRITTNTNTGGLSTGTYGFNICITEPNDLCANAITLTPGTTCTNVGGNVYGATLSATTINAPDCAGTVVYDVWYKFVAQTTNPTITLSSIGSSFTNPAMELLSNNCGGTFTAYYCGTTSIAADFLTPGTTYFIRVYSSSGVAPASPTNAGFNICIVDPAATPPFNDDCASAINLPIWNTCNNISGSVASATLSSGVALAAPCAGTVAYDVWYKFTAITNNTSTITLSSLGANFASSGLQIFSGTCGSLTSIACSNGTSVTTPALTTGNIYYIRVFSTSGPAPNGNARFNICATTTNAPVRFGNSYVNISKKTTGGVVQPGDTLEIRMTVNHTSGTMTALRYVDNVPSKTAMLTGTNDSIRIITNEGLIYKKYTLASGDDAGTYKASPGAGEYNIRLNLGFGATSPGIPVNNTSTEFASATGSMAAGSDRPRGGGGMLFAIAYKVVVTGSVGDTINLFPGQFIYQNGGVDVPLTATPFKILITSPLNLCANSIGLNNAVENGGTFGSGNTLNRSTDLTTPIAGYTFIPDVSAFVAVNDGRYAIVKNLSPRSGTVSNARRQNTCNTPTALGPNDPFSCNNRMFSGFWYIDGDHSGTNNAIGNPAPAAATNSGYMLMVNADYVASEVYRQTITNLCPNTYYEFSAWIRNICPNCGIDSTGTATYRPGVLPNLSFALDNLDYYNSGELDTTGWQKKGFVFRTTPGQTTATFSIRNNAQGGGGNDWTLDDIAIATCLPSMQYSPSINPMVCRGNTLDIYDTVRSYFNNYTNYKWERSIDGGNNWTDITTPVDTTLTLNGSTYQFITKYTIPPSHTTPANSNDLYRVVVATSPSNLLNASCLYTDASTIITLTVNDCGIPLAVDLLSFSGKMNNGNAELLWVTSKENEPVTFSIEKSINGTDFNSIGTIRGYGGNNENNYYHFTDPAIISDKVWYRIAMINKDGKKKYSRIISLNDTAIEFSFNNVVNPFTHELDFEILVPENSRVDATLISLSGKPVRKVSFTVYEGVNSLIISDIETLPAGMYILQVKNKDKIISKKLMKK